MKHIKYLVLSLVFLMIILHTSGCKAWEGRFALFGVEGGTTYFPETDQSLFGFVVNVGNAESVGVGASFSDWEIGIYEDDQLVLEFTQTNYDTFDYRVTVYSNSPIPDSSRYTPGVLNVTSGREIDNWRVAGNIFGDYSPNKMVYRLLITDYNGYSQIIEGEFLYTHAIVDYTQ